MGSFQLHLVFSRWQCGYLLAIHFAALVVVQQKITGSLLAAALTLLLFCTLSWELYCAWPSPRRSTGLRWQEGQWQLLFGEQWRTVGPIRRVCRLPFLLILYCRDSVTKRRYRVVIWRDAINTDTDTDIDKDTGAGIDTDTAVDTAAAWQRLQVYLSL